MADNIIVDAGTDKTVATDDVGDVHFQKVKLDVGGDGASVPFTNTLGTVQNLNAGTITALAKGTISVGTVAVTAGTIATGSLTNLATMHDGTVGNLVKGTVTALAKGTISAGTIGTVVGIGTATNLGSVTNVGTVKEVENLASGTVVSDTPYSYSYHVAGTVNGVVKNAAGFLHAIIVGDAVASSTIEVSDHASDGDGAVVLFLSGDNIGPAVYPVNMTMGTGITTDIVNQTKTTFVYK